MADLKPCPFCQSKQIGYSFKTSTSNFDRIYHAAMYCKDCNAYGPRVIVHPGDKNRDELVKDPLHKQMAKNLWNQYQTQSDIVGGIFGDWKCGKKP